ncbi:seminal metalloprotease 1 [Musca domestica]|uniref:Metalloendopeptidase n=1 Tax=Musca domestica TaxID=7370 RepID=A0A9J7I149_MUSDO|nr:seminal metalloprotease 1 [Musca domestica]
MFKLISVILIVKGVFSLVGCAKLPLNETKFFPNYDNVDYGPEMAGGYLEGDILPDTTRNGLPELKWPGNTVKYVFCGDFTAEQKKSVRQCHRMLSNRTCLRFVETTKSDFGYVCITNEPNGCWSALGYRGTKSQNMNLGPGCLRNVYIICHEFIHALGFSHEHNSYNRDDYVRIRFGNIIDGMKYGFTKRVNSKDCRVHFNKASIMAYGPHAFSKNGFETITPRDGVYTGMGQRRRIPESDFRKINRMYCYNNCTSTLNTKAPKIIKLSS